MFKKMLLGKKLWQFLMLIMFTGLLLFAFSVGYPALRRSQAVRQAGDGVAGGTAVLATSVGRLSPEPLRMLAQQNTTGDYATLCALLAQVKWELGADRLYIVTRLGSGETVYLLDADYSSTGKAGTDYHAAQEVMQGTVEQKSRQLLTALFAGGKKAQYLDEIVQTEDGRNVIVSLAPVYDQSGVPIAAVVLEAPVGAVNFMQLGPVDLSITAWVGAGMLAVGFALWMPLRGRRKRIIAEEREEAKAAKRGEPMAELPVAEAKPAPEAAAEPASEPDLELPTPTLELPGADSTGDE